MTSTTFCATIVGMPLSVHTQSILRLITALANSDLEGETIATQADVRTFALAHDFSPPVHITADDVPGLQSLRHRIRAVFADVDGPADARAADLANALLQETHALPQLQRHDGWGWHLHAVPNEAGIAVRTAADIAIALADAVIDEEVSRIGRCAADDCGALFVDLSRNRSKRFCDRGNCANRTHVAAYRARLTP
ncbi:Putative stress-induced transcription regulator [Brevibacterium jeotgali]|uniref:Stress-induced transcription regulator n=2 Tax=Brevibacterium jeotgali TaxID=1262550 RepID=A0A2H1L447_9MICO|nr:putative stress-induced transcription regulator [Brevibacterium jeotgali]SMY11664.1 Putative stress-induced transcription regulator [Brevibacterium jeotgali]